MKYLCELMITLCRERRVLVRLGGDRIDAVGRRQETQVRLFDYDG